MMLDVFTNVESELDTEFGNLANVKRLMAAKSKMSDARFKEICDRVNQDILEEEIERSNLDKKALLA